ncbi:hypothetical protein [Anaerotignum sp.]|uniref:hypothetical protein n=1 Tax=Anaerotignum sp. TaxID=2039241 RepID=UPI003736CBA6
MGSGIWKWAVAVGCAGILLMFGAILAANRWEGMFSMGVFLGLVCIWGALLLLAVAWVLELWRSLRDGTYLLTLLWLFLGLLVLIPFCLRLFGT